MNYVEIDINKINDNVENIIEKYDNYKYYIGVVKGNAYGHGFEIVKTLVKCGINYLAVSTISEALEVRKLVKTPILCLQPVSFEDLKLAEENNITITISSYEYYKKLIETKHKLKVHIKLDTGMNRLGINSKEELEEIYNELLENKNIELEGLYTHMATLGLIDKKWDNQVDKFLTLTSNIDLTKIKIIHIYSSNSLITHPKLAFTNGIRIGILMFGIGPRPIIYSGLMGKLKKAKHNHLIKKYHISETLNDYSLDISPAFKLMSKVVEIKEVPKGEYIGYGLKYKTKKNVRVAIVPIGYADGLSLKNSGNFVTINDKKYKIVGSVNMRMLTVVVDDNVNVDDEVIVIGDNIRQVALHNGMTPHSTMTMISSDIKRIYK